MHARSTHVLCTLLCAAFAVGAPFTVALAQAKPIVSTGSSSFDRVTNDAALANGIELRDGDMRMQITALRDDVLRIRASRSSPLPEDASWAVLPEARKSSVAVTQDSNAISAGFHTAALRVSVDRSTGLLTVRDNAGTVLQQDAAPMTYDGDSFRIAKVMPADEHYFGLGDKTGAFDRRNQAFRLWNTDSYAWQESTDPIYKSIPFYLSYRAGTSVGILIDNTWPCSYDFGKSADNQLLYRAENGPATIYFLYGPSAKQVLKSFAWLTGPTPLPPLWALGFQQSRYSYMTQARVLEVANRLRADKIPSDAVYLDVDYQQKKRPFTVDTASFPDMPGLVKSLHDEQFHVVAITDLHIADLPHQGYAPYDSGTAGDHFVKNPDGSIFVGPVWPGPSVFPDFTQHQTRVWWGSLYEHFVHIGIDGFWNDMNEPSVFTALLTMPNDVVHRIDEPGFLSRSATHREIHNVYGMENSRATFDGMLTLRPTVRPFVLTRASYAGGQRYAATWTGDNSAIWNHLRLTTSMLKNLGLSGFSLAGADVGGYAGTPSPELLTKWLEIAAFQPIDRDHAEKGTGDHEVWANGPEQEAIRRHFIEERYKLLPYLYTTMEDNTRTGLPLLRPLFLEFPNAAPDHHPLDIDLNTSGEFMVGPDLIVAPPPFPDKMDRYQATLPSSGWYDYWSGARVDASQPEVSVNGILTANEPSLTSVEILPEPAVLPVFVRPGSILPVAPVVQNTAERPTGPLTLRVFPGPDCKGAVYQDDGESFAFESGGFLRMKATCQVTDQGVTIEIGKHEGKYPAWWKEVAMEVNGLPGGMTSLHINGKVAPFQATGATLRFIAPDDGKGIHVDIR